jgi:perosamine synthetase
MIPVYQPTVYKASAHEAVESGWISNHGPFVGKATELLKQAVGCRHAILMSNGTAATHAMFLALKCLHPHIRKIYVPDHVYVAAWNAALMAFPAHMLEVLPAHPDTYNVEWTDDRLASLDRDAAVLIVHNMGQIVNVPRLKRLRPDLVFVEDACEGLFGKYSASSCVGASDAVLCSSASFYGNKIITSGEGGAFLTNHDEVAAYVRHVYTQGMTGTQFVHDMLAYNYRMTNVQAAFLYDQLQDLNAILAQKRRVFEQYRAALSALPGIVLPRSEEGTEAAPWMVSIRMVGHQMPPQDTAAFFRSRGVETRPFFYSYTAHEHLKGLVSATAAAAAAAAEPLLHHEYLVLPSSPSLTADQIAKVCAVVEQCLNARQLTAI